MFGGGLARRAGRAVSAQRIFIQVWAARMRNTLVLLYLVIYVFLSFGTSHDVCFVQKSECSLCAPWASFYTQRGCHSGTQEVASYSGTSLSLDQHRTNTFYVTPTSTLALLGTATEVIPSFAASPRLAMRLGRRGMQHHSGQPTAVLAKW